MAANDDAGTIPKRICLLFCSSVNLSKPVIITPMNAKPVLFLSLLVNLALAGGLVWAVKSRSTPVPTSAATVESKAAAAPPATAAAAHPETVTHTVALEQKFDWRVVESEDYRKYIANLRSIGCPEETIRDIIVADVNKLFESRRRALTVTTNKFKFWKAGNPMAGMFDSDRMEKSQALNKEKRALLVELLGVAPDEKPDIAAGVTDMFASMMDFLPSDKQAQVIDVMMKYQAKLAKSMGNGTPDAEDMKNMRKVQKDMETEIASLMSPEEFQDYQLRMSQTAMVMRMQLASFEPNEQEFRDLFKFKKAYEDEFGLAGMGTATKEEKAKADAAKKELDAQIKTLLGEARYAEYERSQDWTYQNLYRVAERNGLTKDDTVKVYDMKKVAESQAGKIRSDKSLSADQRAAALAGIRSETENSMRTVMGEKAYNTYVNQQSTYWLKGISPDPKTPAP